MSFTIYPDGSIGWRGGPGQRRPVKPQVELRGGATADPPAIDIGADILNIERKPAEPARITIYRQSRQDAGYRDIFVSRMASNW